MPTKIEKKKATRAMMLIASGSTACKNEMVSLCCCGKVGLQLILLEISFWNKRKTKDEKKRAKESSPKEIFIEAIGAGL